MTTTASRRIAFSAALLAAAICVAGQGVSPGRTDAVTAVEARCPTFSWEVETAASLHELVVYAFPPHLGDEQILLAELDSATEVLYQQLPGGATGWTPSGDQCLTPGGRYAWFVRAVATHAQTGLEEPGDWSRGRYFAIPAAPSVDEVRDALAVLERWQAGEPGQESREAPADTRRRVARSSGGFKSVPTASAAIRGEHPDTSGETYGVVGISDSPDGAGLAAANTAGGPDLVLDGSASGVPDTLLSESGVDRSSPAHQVFELTNSGTGRLHLDVEGDMTADVVRTEEVVVSGMTVVDDSGDWLGNGSTVPCDGCVEATSLADGAVISRKIQDGQVRTADLDNNAVTTGKIADGTITAADVDPSSSIYVSKGQLYINSETITFGAPGFIAMSVYCSDANDLPLTGSCWGSTGALEANSSELRNWNNQTLPAEYGCRFLSTVPGTYYGFATIACIAVP